MIGLLTVVSIAISAVAAPVFDKNVPAEIKQQIVADMNAVGSVNSAQSSQLHQHIFGPVLGTAYLNFFETRIQKIGISTCGSAIAVACVNPFLGSNKMWLTQNYIKFSHPQVARSMIVFHEARHSEIKNGNWRHATCPKPFNDPAGNPIKSIWTGSSLAGEPACDVTPFGSYGSSLIMLKNISKFCTTCNEKVRMDAGLYADDQLKRIINPQAFAAIRQDLYTR